MAFNEELGEKLEEMSVLGQTAFTAFTQLTRAERQVERRRRDLERRLREMPEEEMPLYAAATELFRTTAEEAN